jgi:glucose/arabinose dehydrogenase
MIKTFTTVALPWQCILLLLLLGYQNVFSQAPQPGFSSVVVSSQWNEAVGLTFTSDGTDMFVWERGGKVYVVTGGNKSLVLDIAEEVGAWHDHGLLGFALHPQFQQNGYIYLLYTVDRHHLINFGTAAYSPTANDYFSATIARLTRYKLIKSGGLYSVLAGSRKILIGETKSTGIASIERSHLSGSLVFGTDQTLLISTGDGANGNGIDPGSGTGTYYAQALADGILTDAINVGTFRAQTLDCLNGKILRIDPETGDGIPSNPFYDPTRPNAAISKVWALGTRNPFRMSLKPGSGSHNPNDANPGVLYFGDVGFFSWEEINVCDKPGMNFGWPIFEGLQNSSIYATLNTPNKFAPNPLYQVNGCTQQYFNYQNLLK